MTELITTLAAANKLIQEQALTITELRSTMSENNEFYHGQLTTLVKKLRDFELNNNRRVS